MPKKKLNEIKQTHGKVETFQPSTLDQVWGDTGMNKYSTLSIDEYKKNLSEMDKADLRTHATKVGIIPIDDREQMERRLVKAFHSHVGGYQQPRTTAKLPNPPSKDVLKILAEGR